MMCVVRIYQSPFKVPRLQFYPPYEDSNQTSVYRLFPAQVSWLRLLQLTWKYRPIKPTGPRGTFGMSNRLLWQTADCNLPSFKATHCQALSQTMTMLSRKNVFFCKPLGRFWNGAMCRPWRSYAICKNFYLYCAQLHPGERLTTCYRLDPWQV